MELVKRLNWQLLINRTLTLNWGVNLFGAIDHIAHIGDATPVAAPVVLRQKFAGEWPTDHYPVIVDYRLGGAQERR
jgi:hypothetical protein